MVALLVGKVSTYGQWNGGSYDLSGTTPGTKYYFLAGTSPMGYFDKVVTVNGTTYAAGTTFPVGTVNAYTVSGGYTTDFLMHCVPNAPTLSASGGSYQGSTYHVPQGETVTITVADNYFYGRNDWGTTSSLIASNQSSYTVTNNTGSYSYLWSGTDGLGHTTSFNVDICWDPPVTPTQYTLTPSAGANGSISPSTPQTVTAGNNQTFNFSPNSGYEVDQVKVDGASVSFSGNSYTFTNVQASHTINVTFKLVETAVEAVAAQKLIAYSPNAGALTVKSGYPGTLNLYDLTGQLVKTVQLGESEITLYNLPSGLAIGAFAPRGGGGSETFKTLVK